MSIKVNHNRSDNKSRSPQGSNLGCLRWACRLRPRVTLRLLAVLTGLALLALRRTTALSLKLATATTPATVVAPRVLALVVSCNSAVLILWLAWLAHRAGDGSGDVLRRLVDVQVLLNGLGNRLDLGA